MRFRPQPAYALEILLSKGDHNGRSAPALRLLYDYPWFVGFGVSGVVYVMWMKWHGVISAMPSQS
jgi:cytosine/uracil/thiamine/allantoin permease